MKSITGILLLFVLYQLLTCLHASAQDSTTRIEQVMSVPDKVFLRVDKRAEQAEALLTKQTEGYLGRLEKQEQRLKRRMMKKDSLKAVEVFGDVKARYTQLKATSGKVSRFAQVYSGRLDSLAAGLQFIQAAEWGSLAEKVDLQKSLDKLSGLQDKLNQTDQISRYLRQREHQLKEQLGQLGMLKEFRRYREQVYYYQAQLKEYKDLFERPDKLAQRMLGMAEKLPQFRGFFVRHSQLAGMFSLPGAETVEAGSAAVSEANIQGLQTSASINEVLQDRFGSNRSMVSQALQQGGRSKGGLQNPISVLKDQVSHYASGSVGNGNRNDGERMLDFKPNSQKTKRFIQRLEVGMNVQTQRARSFFPATSDLGLSIGYKLNERSVIGVGGAYKMGWGRDIRHVSISHQGVGGRSFFDYKLKGNFWLLGGWEMNYRREFRNIDVLKDYSAWQKSALLGVSKKYQIGSKMKGNLQMLYDALWKQQTPRTQPITFRLGYGLK